MQVEFFLLLVLFQGWLFPFPRALLLLSSGAFYSIFQGLCFSFLKEGLLPFSKGFSVLPLQILLQENGKGHLPFSRLLQGILFLGSGPQAFFSKKGFHSISKAVKNQVLVHAMVLFM